MSGAPRLGILVILDGFGLNPSSNDNAITLAKTPTWDRICRTYPITQLDASEHHVGLPAGFMGNSEVGHLNIGAGRIVYQDFSLISRAIEDGRFFKNPVFIELFDRIKSASSRKKKSLHVMGLVSDGGVHSHIDHIEALIKMASENGIEHVWVHAFTDGRDTAPTSGKGFISRLASTCAKFRGAKIATVSGRFYAMDRDKRWDRTELAYQAIVTAHSPVKFTDPSAYIAESYDKGETDEFIIPAIAKYYPGISDGDGVVFVNFRADRARQLTRALTEDEFPFFTREGLPTLSGMVTMSRYDESFNLPVAYQKQTPEQTIGEVISKLGLQQLRIAETEKYAHVTYFFNGGVEKAFPGEERCLIPSPRDVRTYDEKPEMSAFEVTDKLLSELNSGKYSFVVVNFANPDMVGHTGNLNAAIRAVETVDQCLSKILTWVEKHGALTAITADHGNCEQMTDAKGVPLTSHTLLPVPFVLIDPEHKDHALKSSGKLSDIAPTLLTMMHIDIPKEMTGHSLV